HHAGVPRLHGLSADQQRGTRGRGEERAPGHGPGEDQRVELGRDRRRRRAGARRREPRGCGPEGPGVGRRGRHRQPEGDGVHPARGRHRGPTCGLRHAALRRQPAARAIAAERRSRSQRRRVARRPGGAGLDPQPERPRLACGPDARPGGARVLPLRVHHPAAADGPRHLGLVAAESGVKLGRIAILFLLVAGLGAYLYWVEVPKARQEATKAKLVTATPDDVTAVNLVFPDREIALRKKDGVWRLEKPIDAPADDAAVLSLIRSVTDADVQKSLDETPSDLSSFGLDKPDPTVRLSTAKGDLPAIAIGKNAAIGGKTYVRVGDDQKVVLTSSALKVAVNKQVKDLRDKQLLAFKDDDVTRIDITPADGPPVALVRKDKDVWTLEPGDQPADITEVRSYLSSLRSTRAVDFPDSDVAAAGLDQPRLNLTL